MNKKAKQNTFIWIIAIVAIVIAVGLYFYRPVITTTTITTKKYCRRNTIDTSRLSSAEHPAKCIGH